MINELWLNLPVKDVQRATDFFTAIGFTQNTRFPANEHSASFIVGTKGMVVMFVSEQMFKGFASADAADTSKSNEVLFSFDAESPAEVDEIAAKVRAAGGTIYGEPGYSQGWMYGCGFIDPDGHRWSILYMDMEKMPKG